MPRLRACALTLVLSAAAAAQDEPPPPPRAPGAEADAAAAELERRFAAFRAVDRELGLLRLELRRAREGVAEIGALLESMEADTTAEDAEDPAFRARVEALVRKLAAARSVLHASREENGRRLEDLRSRAIAAFTGLMPDVEAAVERWPGHARLRLLRGLLYASQERFDLARADAEAAVLERPDDPRVLLLLGRCLVVDNRFPEAAGLFARAHELRPDDETRAYHALGLYTVNRFAEALAARRAIARPEELPADLQLRLDWWLGEDALEEAAAAWAEEETRRAEEAARGDLPRVVLETSRGRVVVELFEDSAPRAVAGFVQLVREGFYDDLTWHRVVPNLLAQTGDPATRPGAGPDARSPGYRIRDDEGLGRRHVRGSLSLARRPGVPDSAGGQVFITVMPAPALDDHHRVFGRVVEGQRVVDALREDDRVVTARVLRARDHPYEGAEVREEDRAPARR